MSSEISFKHVVIDKSPPENPWIKAAADLDGDGKTDIIIGGAKGPLVWYRNPDWAKFIVAESGYNSVGAAVADIDGDRDLDIALGGVVWYENPGSGVALGKAHWKPHLIEMRRGHDIKAGNWIQHIPKAFEFLPARGVGGVA
ncbi:MAG: VCBS repeat-containing protein [Verrucomicrobia bacterium]|nr:VCBS repeat-containing protein [Verrucomicrobiota bacterium]